jgi:molybdate transport system substrate-binding protein
MKKILPILLVFILLLLYRQVSAASLRVAVAANFSTTLLLIKQRFEKAFNHNVVIIRGSTGKLYAQIRHGAPFDVFLAADVERPLRLEQDHLIADHSRYTYAIGRLALWVPVRGAVNKRRESKVDIIRDKLMSGEFNKLAIANPKTAPYGRAAIEVMRYLNIYKQCQPKLVYGENIAQAFQYVESGSAELGFVALSYVKDRSSEVWLPPSQAYTQLEQQLVILKTSKNQALARSFVDFMQRKDIKSLIQAQGYQTL